MTQNKSLVTLRRAQAAAGLPRCREAFYASVISDFIIFASSCYLHLSTLELYVSDLLQPIRLVQFIMASNHACHCILHDNWTNMSNTNNITITL